MTISRALAPAVLLLLAACQMPQPAISATAGDGVRVQYNGGERYEGVLAVAKEGCAAYKKTPVLVGTRCLEAICINKEAVFRCE